MIKKVLNTIKHYNMLVNGDYVVVGVSGGADSMALLHVLMNCGLDLKIHAVHVNHMLRDGEADRDQLFVEDYCKQNNIRFTSYKINICEEAQKLGISLEEAGRLKRYEAFEKTREGINANKIAAAHNQNDQTETIIMRLARGTGIKGLTGIPPVRDNLIRPLIQCSRQDIERYCSDNGIDYITDGTNFLDVYTRNKLRLNFIPWLKQELNPQLDYAISNMSSMLSEDNDYLEKCASKEFELCSQINNDGSVFLDINKILQCHKALRSRIIRISIETVSKSLKDVSHTNITDVMALLEKQTSKKIILSNNIIVEKIYSQLKVYKKTNEKCINHQKDFCYELNLGKILYVPEIKKYFLATTDNNNIIAKDFLVDRKDANICTRMFDYDTIKGNIRIRSKKNGDKIHIRGVGNKKLSDFFIDNKISKETRSTTAILCDGNDEIFWIVDYRCIDKFKAGSYTKNFVYITVWEGDCKNGRTY